jgi:hypothetical protein
MNEKSDTCLWHASRIFSIFASDSPFINNKSWNRVSAAASNVRRISQSDLFGAHQQTHNSWIPGSFQFCNIGSSYTARMKAVHRNGIRVLGFLSGVLLISIEVNFFSNGFAHGISAGSETKLKRDGNSCGTAPKRTPTVHSKKSRDCCSFSLRTIGCNEAA